ncbi:unnamed protein product [Durusdinium trenchii]|uniref:Uncharacterized protein n=2 Tax=Durusdinium trenchii TaxID=1381693 RepID=A0ABP0M9P4_9DINO
MASGSIKCMACPDYESPDREAYREHCATKWHQYNTNERMMGRRTLSEEEYLAKIAPPPPVAPETKVEEIKESEAQGEHVSVCVVFRHKEEKWSHIFKIPKGTTVMDLKKSMVKPSSPSDDALLFSLKRGMIRPSHFETIDQDETFDFYFIGAEEGRTLLERDERRRREEQAWSQ